MNKTALKNFAVYSRNKLIEDITLKASLVGVTSKGIEKPLEESDDFMIFDIGLSEPHKIEKEQIKQRRQLIEELKRRTEVSDYKAAFEGLIEEVAYTWFNRIIALRFMEVNDYMPDHIRILSSGKESDNVPEIVTEVFDSELNFTDEENNLIIRLKESGTTKDLDELFNFLFIKTCNSMHGYLPELFEKSNDYTELLYNVSFVDTESVVYKLLNNVDETDFDIESEDGNGQVEIIGWMYQYYNIEPKAKVFARPKGQKIRKEDVPAATQLFTPDWIVRYMVENSLGRLWYEGHNDDELKSKWKYYLDEAKQEESVEQKLVKIRNEYKNIKPEDIKLIDPCMGSGHILVYAFDVLVDIYKSQGYTEREAAKNILINNLYGLDIDKRAYQLSYFALMMKARSYDRRILKRGIKPSVLSINETNLFDRNLLKCFGNNLTKNEREKAIEEINYILDLFIDSKEYGSLLQVNKCDWYLLKEFVDDNIKRGQMSIETVNIDECAKELKCLIEQARLLSQKYDVVVTNPPYMGGRGMSAKLSSYAKKEYKDSKSDLFAMFIERCNLMTASNKYTAMITMHSWMFLSTYEKFRINMMRTDIINMAHLGARAFDKIGGEVVQTTAWINCKRNIISFKARYIELVDINGEMEKRNKYMNALGNKECGYYYESKKSNFEKIPGSPITYWANEKVIDIFGKQNTIGNMARPRLGFATGDNERFMKNWFEVDYHKIGFGYRNREKATKGNKKWFPTNKGGQYRRWFGNLELVVNWENDGYEIRNFKDKNGKLRSRPQNLIDCFSSGITWTVITNNSSFRYSSSGMLYNNKGPILGEDNSEFNFYLLAYLNSKVSRYLLSILSPTIGFEAGYVAKIPFIKGIENEMEINERSKNCINLSRTDWNSFETSWNFLINPLINSYEKDSDNYFLKNSDMMDLFWEDKNTEVNSQMIYQIKKSIKKEYEIYKQSVEFRFKTLKVNEEEINHIFIQIYGLQDELTPEVLDKDITVARIYDTKSDIPGSMKGNKYVLTKQDVIKQLISYAVGCMFGRYSLDVEGLVYAGGDFDTSKYKTFIPDSDNCIPITDNKYFDDDIVTRFVEFVKVVYGDETLEENLDFIADALGGKGDNRERIRNYFLKDFFKDHCKMYKKRPIYWLYDSGKQNGFKVLVYLHRYNDQTTGIVRANYLHEIQKYYRATVANLKNELNSNTSAYSRKVAEDRIKKIEKQLDECKAFDEKMGHLANERIAIDLDDGVKVNYEKVQTDRDGEVLQVLAKIK